MPACSILIVDDEPGIRELLAIMLETSGHTVVTAEDGVQAPKVMASRHIDVVITDLLMPERDGLEFITEVRKKYPAVKIIAMSGGGHIARDSYLRIAKTFGAHYLLEKPFNQASVLGAIELVLKMP
jgi:two-component system cell cycle response regulator CpdR